MDKVNIDFNDAIYQETGISASSIALREKDVVLGNGDVLTVQVIKKDLINQKDIYVTLKDAQGFPVKDLQIKTADKVIKTGHSHTVILENVSSNLLDSIKLSSETLGLQLELTIGFEKERTPPDKKMRAKKEVRASAKRKMTK